MLPPENAGPPRRDFKGLEDPPVQQAHVPGRTFLIKAPRLGSISVGSPVFFRDLDVGEVLGWDIAHMAESVSIRVFVREPYDSYVNDQTRFWNASGFSLKLGGAGVDVQVESLRAMLLGGIAFENPPGSDQLATSAENHTFPLFADRDAADNASYNRKIQLVSYFSGSVRGIGPGSEVTMHGLTIGHVTDVRLHFDPATDTVAVPVHYEVEPERILGVGSKAVFNTEAEAANALIKKGLRASLQTASLITGQQVVALEFEPNAPVMPVQMEGTNVVLPTTDTGSISGLQASAATLLDKLNSIPFDQIGKNANDILASVNNLTSAPQIRQMLNDLASTAATASEFTRQLNTTTGPALKQLPEVTASLQKTLTDVDHLFMSLNTGYGDDTKFNRDLERLVVQMNEAVRSFQNLADVLTQHPEALIKGRPGGVSP
jgi:paraquat-inducible protein B